MHTLLFFLQAAAVVMLTVVYGLLVILVMPFFGKQVFFPMARNWSRILLAICGVKIRVQGGDDVATNAGVVFVCNHQSLFDIPVLLSALPGNVAIMYKRELENIPAFGWALKFSPFIPVTREDPRNAMASIEEAAAAIRKGGSVIVFPEGTRSADGMLGVFRRGAIAVALRSGKPLVPLAISGTNAILPKKSLRFNAGTVRLTVAERIETHGITDRAAEKHLLADLRRIIAEMLGENEPPK